MLRTCHGAIVPRLPTEAKNPTLMGVGSRPHRNSFLLPKAMGLGAMPAASVGMAPCLPATGTNYDADGQWPTLQPAALLFTRASRIGNFGGSSGAGPAIRAF